MSADQSTNESDASQWQQQIEGEWWGTPAVWDHAGNHTGFIKVARSSVHADGKTMYYMDTVFDNDGPLRSRLEFRDFAFELNDAGKDRIYLGPDFIGTGHPYGHVVDAHYYSPAWKAELNTLVHVLADNETQIYSSLLYDGPTVCAVFNGVYKVAFDYQTNAETRQRIDAFCAGERTAGRMPHTIPVKTSGRWAGSCQVYGPDQEPVGELELTIEHTPTSLLRARQTVRMTGLIEREYTFDRYHDANHHTYDGPDLFGNGYAYGRALYTVQHLYAESTKIRGREFLYDDQLSMSVVWKWFAGEQMQYLIFGSLAWTAD